MEVLKPQLLRALVSQIHKLFQVFLDNLPDALAGFPNRLALG